jgi:hypothetical protein
MASPEASKPINNQVGAILAVSNATLNSKEDRCIGVCMWSQVSRYE